MKPSAFKKARFKERKEQQFRHDCFELIKVYRCCNPEFAMQLQSEFERVAGPVGDTKRLATAAHLLLAMTKAFERHHYGRLHR